MTTRLDFLKTGAAAVLAGAPALHSRSRADADIILRGGTVFDGPAPPRERPTS
ncbi:MAG TPA: twin-arginine translocation signal domain-containing protein [Gemmatimonadaceae bacterium]